MHFIGAKLNRIKEYLKLKQNSLADAMINRGSGMIADPSASGNIFYVAIMAVLAVSFLSSAIPTAYSNWGNATAANGSMANADSGDKSLWNLGKMVVVGGTLLLVVGMFLKRN